MRTLSIVLSLFLFSCSSYNQMATPSAKVITDSFDGSLMVYQDNVSAASSLSEGWHTLGFRWVKKYPDIIYLSVGTNGITNISSVAFNIDGKIIELNDPASNLTDYGDWSTRPFAISLDDFKLLAEGNTVKMKVVMIDTFTVSTFGKNHPSAIVVGKFDKFLQLISENL